MLGQYPFHLRNYDYKFVQIYTLFGTVIHLKTVDSRVKGDPNRIPPGAKWHQHPAPIMTKEKNRKRRKTKNEKKKKPKKSSLWCHVVFFGRPSSCAAKGWAGHCTGAAPVLHHYTAVPSETGKNKNRDPELMRVANFDASLFPGPSFDPKRFSIRSKVARKLD